MIYTLQHYRVDATLEGHAQFIGRVSSNNIRRDSRRHLTIGDASWSNGFVLMAREKR